MPKTLSNTTASFAPAKFFTSPVRVGKKGIFLQVPAELKSHLNLEEGKVHWTVVNGVLQVCPKEPTAVIPVLNLKEEFNTPRC